MTDFLSSLFGKPVRVLNIQPERESDDFIAGAFELLRQHLKDDDEGDVTIELEKDEEGRPRFLGKGKFKIVDR